MRALAAALILAAAPAAAEVEVQTPQGFVSTREVTVAAPPARVYAALGEVGRWWNDSHSWSGRAANMTLDLRAGGCFCERWAAGSVEHLHIVRAEPGRALIGRGGLGPLLDQGAAGVLGWSLEPLDGGRATRLVQSYRVGGLLPGDAAKLAPLVDAVLGEQLARLKAHVEAGEPKR